MANTPFISVEDAIANESQGYIDFVVRLNQPSVNIVTVGYETADGTALYDPSNPPKGDYLGAVGIVTFTPGETVKTVRITVFPNSEPVDQSSPSNIPGVRESFQLSLDSPTNAAISRPIGIGTIIDDYLAPTPVVSANNIVVDEAAGTATFIVSLDQPSLSEVTLDYATQDGTALAEGDYTAKTGSLTFAPGETAKTVTVDLNADNADELDESFNLVLSKVAGANLPDETGTAVIAGRSEATTQTIRVENAAALESAGGIDFIVRLDNPSTDTVTVDYDTSDGTATATGDYTAQSGTLTFAPGTTVQAVHIDLDDDAIAESAEGFRLLLSNPSNGFGLFNDTAVGTIHNDDTVLPVVSISDPIVDEADREAVFVITLDHPSSEEVSMAYATVLGSAKSAEGDYLNQKGDLVFAPGETLKTVRVGLINSADREFSETFNLEVSNIKGAIGPNPDGTADGTAVIVKSDAIQAISPTISVEDSSFGEAQGYTDFLIRLSAPSANVVSVDYALSGASAVVSNNYMDQTGTLSFAPGETVKTVRVIVKDDYAPTFDETYQLDLKAPVNGTLGRSTGFATIINDDGYDGMPSITVGDLVVDETTQEAVFTLTLNWPSPSLVTLHYATQDGTALAGSDYQSISGTLSFAPGVVSQTVRVPLLSDSVQENSEFFRLSLSDVMGAAVPDQQSAVHDQVAAAVIVADSAPATATPTVNVEDLVVGESQGYADFVVRLDAPGKDTVIVSYTTNPGSALEVSGQSGDFYPQTGTLSFAPGETVKTVRISLFDDTLAETVKNFSLSLTNPVHGALGRSVGVATVIDDDGGTVIPSVSVKDTLVDESTGEAVFTVVLSRPTAGVVSMLYDTVAGTATAGDYIGQSKGILTFAPGEMAKTVRIALVNDAQEENNETFQLKLSNISGATLDDATGIATIAANDAAPVTALQLSVDDASANESQGYVDFLVRLSVPGQESVSVDYSLSADTAAEGSDYTDQSGTLTFAPGEMTKMVRVGLIDDIASESFEDFSLTLANPQGAAVSDGTGVATIADNDAVTGAPVVSVQGPAEKVDEAAGVAVFTVSLDRPSTEIVTLDYATQDGAAQAGSDYVEAHGPLTFAPGEVSKTVRVNLIDDTGYEEGEGEDFTLALKNLTNANAGATQDVATIQDNDTSLAAVRGIMVDEAGSLEKAGKAVFTISLDQPSSGPVTVDYRTIDGSATAGTDFAGIPTGQVTFAPGETAKTVEISLIDDFERESSETFSLELTGISGGRLGPNATATATITDNDSGKVSVDEVLVDEAGKEATFMVRLERPSTGPVTLDYATVEGTALANSDFIAASGNLTFTPGETEKTVKVALVNDSLSEDAETFGLTLSNVQGASPSDADATAMIAASDQDAAAQPLLSVEDAMAGEGQGYTEFVVRLSAPSALPVRVGYQTANGNAIYNDPEDPANPNDFLGQTGTLDFAPGETVKTVRVVLTDDIAVEDRENFQLVLNNPLNAALSKATGIATLVDNEVGLVMPSITINDVTTDGNLLFIPPATFTITLDRPSTETIKVHYSTQDGTATGRDYRAVSGTLEFAPGETSKTVDVIVNNNPALDQSFNLVLSEPSGATLHNAAGTATIAGVAPQKDIPIASIEDVVVGEGQGFVDVVVRLDGYRGSTSDPVSLDYKLLNGYESGSPSANANSDYIDATGTITFALGQTVQTVRLKLVDDTQSEAPEKFQMELLNPTNATLGSHSKSTITIIDNDPAIPTPTATVTGVVVDEAAGQAIFTVALDRPTSGQVTLNYTTRDGSAEDGTDYTAANGVLSFAPGETVKTVVIDIINDNLAESSESFDLALSDAVGLILADPDATALIAANDGGNATAPEISVEDAVANEDEGQAQFIVRLSAPSAKTVSVQYATADGTAVADGDYASQAGTLTFAPGETAKAVNVKLADDAVAETTQGFQLALSKPVNASLADAAGLATVLDDDLVADRPTLSIGDIVVDATSGEATFTLSLDRAATTTVTLDYATSPDGSAVAGTDYTAISGSLAFAPGETVKTVKVPLLDSAGPLRDFALTLSNLVDAEAPDTAGHASIAANAASPAQVSTLDIEYAQAGETQGYIDFIVRLSAPNANTITVDYRTEDGSAVAATEDAAGDYLTQSGTLRFAPGETLKTVRVALADDNAHESAEGFQLVLTNPQGFQLPGDIPSNAWLGHSVGAATLVDNDLATDSQVAVSTALAIGDVIVDEAAGEAVFTLSLDRPSASPVTLSYATADTDGGAVAGIDYYAVAGTLSFAPGETVKTVRVPIVNDAATELGETFDLKLSNIIGATAPDPKDPSDPNDPSGLAVIAASDQAPKAAPTIRAEDASVQEGQGYADFVVRLDAPSTQAVTVDYAATAGSALADSDFLAQSGTLHFAPGETVKTVRVALADDAVAENSESFQLVLSNPARATLDPAQASGTATLADDDLAPKLPVVSIGDLVVDEMAREAVFTVTLDRPALGLAYMDYATADGSATDGADYAAASGVLAFAPGETSKTVRVALLDDASPEPGETFSLKLSGVTGAIAPDAQGAAVIAASDAASVNTPIVSAEDALAGEGQGYADFVVRLSAPSANTVVVDYQTQDATALVGDDGGDYLAQSGTLSFAPGETVKTVRVWVSEDAAPEGNEAFHLVLSHPQAFDLARNAPANASLGRATAAASIVDNDRAADLPLVTVSDAFVDEAAGEAVFSLVLHRPQNYTATVSLDYQTVDGEAKAGADYAAVSGQISFVPGETVKTVRVPLLNDASAESGEAFGLRLSNPMGAEAPGLDARALIAANDAATSTQPGITVEDAIAGEDQGYVDFVVRLDAPSAEPVSVDYATAPGAALEGAGADFVAQTGTLRFAPGETVQTVRVAVADDTAVELAESFQLLLSQPSQGALSRPVGTATILDQDSVLDLPHVLIDAPVIDEAAGEAVFTVRLDRPAPSTTTVTLDYQTADGSATAADGDYSAASGSLAFAPGEVAKTVRVAVHNDAADEFNENFSLALSNISGAVAPVPTGVATIAANDGPAAALPQVGVDDAVVSEGQAYVDFLVRLDAPGTGPVTVHYALGADADPATGDAEPLADFIAQEGTLAFAPGETVKAVRVALVDDALPEAAERFLLTLDLPVDPANPTAPATATLGRATGTATLLDDDGLTGSPKVSVGDVAVDEAGREAVFTVSLDRPSTGVVTLDYATQDGSAQAGKDYAAASGSLAFAPGEVSKTVRVPLREDTVQEDAESFGLALSGVAGATLSDGAATATIADNDSGRLIVSHVVLDERNGIAVFEVSLNQPSTGPVTVDYATKDGSAVATGPNADYEATHGTLNFAPGETRKTVEVRVLDNGGADTPVETFGLTLSKPAGAALGNALGNALGTAVITDTPADPVSVPVASVADVVASEGQGAAEFQVRLSAPSVNTVSLPYQVFAGTATEGEDYVAQSGTLSFAPGETLKTVKVQLVDDATPGELAKSFQLQLAEAGNDDFPVPVNASLGRPVAIGTILDDDIAPQADPDAAPPTPQVSVRGLVVDEAAREAVFTLVLDRASDSRVTLDYQTADGSAAAGADYVATAGSLGFAPGEMAKAVRVPLLDDALQEDSETFSLHIANLAGAAAPEPEGAAVIARSDQPEANTPAINVEDASFGEAQGYGDFIVRLSAPSANLVSVSYSLKEAAAFSPDDYAEQSGILSFAPGETVKAVRVAAVDDAGPTFDETFQIDLKDPVNGLLGRSTAFATIVNDDGFEGQPALSASGPVVDEASGEAVFVLKLTGPSASPVTLDYATADGGATAGLDYLAASGHLSFAPGETVKAVRVPILSDRLAEPSEGFTLTLANVDGAATPNPGGTAPFPAATATIAANGGAAAATPLLSVEDLAIGEGQGYADFVVRLSAPGAVPVSVGYATQAGSAEGTGAGGDYWEQSGSLSFAPGEVVKTVRVSLYNDLAAETAESFGLVLSSPANAGFGRSSGLATIIDNDGATAIPVVTADDPLMDEATGEAVFTVKLDKPSSGVVSLAYATQDGAALAGSDYVATSGALSFAPGEMVKTVRVALLDDAQAEPGEDFKLVLSKVSGAVMPGPSIDETTGTATISASDAAPVNTPVLSAEDALLAEGQGYVEFAVRLDTPSANIVNVDYTVSGAAGIDDPANLLAQEGSLGFAPGETFKTVRVYLPDDATAGPAKSLALRLDHPVNAALGRQEAVAVALDDDGASGVPAASVGDILLAEGGTASFTVTLDRPSTAPVSLNYATLDGTAHAADSDYRAASGVLSFAPGERVKTVLVQVAADGTPEGSESFGLALSGAVGATLADAEATALIAGNGLASANAPRVNVLDAMAGESQGYVDFVVQLDAPSAKPVSVRYATADGGALSQDGKDYLGQQGIISFAPGETLRVVRVALADDLQPELAESFQLELSAPANAGLGRSAAVATVLDDDTDQAVDPITPLALVSSPVLDESSGMAVFTIHLDRPSTSTVTLDYQTADGSAQTTAGDYAAASGSLAFAPGEVAKTVRIAVHDDATAEPSEDFSLALSNAVGAAIPDPAGVATISSNDGAASQPQISVADTVAGEGQAYAEFVVQLDRPSSLPVSVAYLLADATALAGSDYAAQAGSLAFAPGEMTKTVRAALLDDSNSHFGRVTRFLGMRARVQSFGP
jgi:hypothetical protein